MQIINIILTCCVLSGNMALCQKSIDKSILNQDSKTINRIWSLGYYGDFIWNPGFKYSFERVLSKPRRASEIKKTLKQFTLAGHGGAYWNPADHLGVFLRAGVAIRRINKSGRALSFLLYPLGYQRNFLPETYEWRNGEINRVDFPSRGYYAPSLTLAIGKQQSERKRLGNYFAISISVLTNYNAGVLPQLGVEYGSRFNGKSKRRFRS